MKVFTGEVLLMVNLPYMRPFKANTRFGVAQTIDLVTGDNYIDLVSHSPGTAGFRTQLTLDEFSDLLKSEGFIKLYAEIKEKVKV